MTAKVDCRVFVISALYKTKQAILPRKNNQINFGFGKNITIFSNHIRNGLCNGPKRSQMSAIYTSYRSVKENVRLATY